MTLYIFLFSVINKTYSIFFKGVMFLIRMKGMMFSKIKDIASSEKAFVAKIQENNNICSFIRYGGEDYI